MKIVNSIKLTLKNARWAFALVLLLTARGSYAQSDSNESGMLILVGLVAIVAVLVLLVAVYTLQVLKKLETKQKEAGLDAGGEESLWKLFLKVVNNRADEDQEADILLEHDYDGIKELDNHLPPWWKWLFYVTIIWGAVYVIGYHYAGWFPLQEQEYATEMEEANATKLAQQTTSAEAGGFDESALVYTEDAEILAAGSKLYTRNCIPCHGAAGEGNAIGPNLTDNYWLHGGNIKNVFTIIKEGVPSKGMISWESQLSPTQIRDVSIYVLSLVGSNPANGKAPQGTLDNEEGSSEEVTVTEEAEPVAAEAEGVAEDLGAGKAIYTANCAACHLADGGGIIGPNLTDNYWKNSKGDKDGIKNTIISGVAGTSMIAWKGALTDTEIEEVTNYIMAFKGTTAANPKAPEGDLIE